MPTPLASSSTEKQPTTSTSSADGRSLDGTITTNTATTTLLTTLGGDGTQAERSQQLSREEADRLYEENIEEEYAKREGGA